MIRRATECHDEFLEDRGCVVVWGYELNASQLRCHEQRCTGPWAYDEGALKGSNSGKHRLGSMAQEDFPHLAQNTCSAKGFIIASNGPSEGRVNHHSSKVGGQWVSDKALEIRISRDINTIELRVDAMRGA